MAKRHPDLRKGGTYDNTFGRNKSGMSPGQLVILYTFIAKELTERRGSDGEQILREAVRRYGRDRGLTNQKRLLDHNIKINLLTLFNEGRDRPGEPRFTSRVIRNTREERISETLICSFADVWKKYDAKWLGRIYCEEFHLACYEAFSFGKAKINLTAV